MRTYYPNGEPVQRRETRGHAVLRGFGADAGDGHIRYTKAGAVDLYGGSDAAHAVMQARAMRIQRELDERGISLDGSMTYEQFQIAREIVEAVNFE